MISRDVLGRRCHTYIATFQGLNRDNDTDALICAKALSAHYGIPLLVKPDKS